MCFDYDDGEMPEFAEVSVVKCRKPHVCQECGGEIEAGQLAEYQTGKFDGEFYSDYYCGACEATRKKIADHETSEGCSGIEIWCPKGGLNDYCQETAFPRESVKAGQQYLAERRVAVSLRKETAPCQRTL